MVGCLHSLSLSLFNLIPYRLALALDLDGVRFWGLEIPREFNSMQ